MKPILLCLTLALAATGRAAQIELSAALGRPILLADEKQTTYLKVGLTGFDVRRLDRRTPVNIALVLDRSGSMSGEKLARAKEAAIVALDRLDRDDIVSVIAYDSNVEVLVPATRVADRDEIRRAISRLEAGGSTALFAGVSKGAAEVRKFLERRRVNRVILLSDGIANVGPSSPDALGELGASLAKDGIAVTTIGLGLDYNEDLMTALARQSDGNHAFCENYADLARIFDREFGDVLSVVAQEITIRIRCADGVRPVRVLGREAEITGQTVTATLNQLYGGQEKYLLLEVELPPTRNGRSRDVADVTVTYTNLATHQTGRLTRSVSARFTDSLAEVERHENRDVMVAVIEQIATEKNKLALELRDQGKIEEARGVLIENARVLREHATRYQSDRLESYFNQQLGDSSNLEGEKWKAGRKSMREGQFRNAQQQQ